VTRFNCCEVSLDRLAQALDDVAAELWQFTQEEHAMVRQRYITQYRDTTAPYQFHIRDRVVGGKGTGRDEDGAVAGRPATRWMSVDSISTAHTYGVPRRPLPTMPLES
jgi:hypothetical protein